MKKLHIKALAMLLLGGSMVSCGDDFLDSKIYDGIDIETGLNSVNNIGHALNGTYYSFYRYYFAGNYATSFGDIASDLAYWNRSSSHFNAINQFTPSVTDTYLSYIWEYGYKVVDNSARIIKAGEAMKENVHEDEIADLDMYLAEAYALRAYANLVLVNVFAHQVMVDGQDFSAQPGIVVINEPVAAGTMVSRSTVGDAYTSIVNDLKSSISYFELAGQTKENRVYMSPAAAWGLLSRAYLYMEKFDESIDAAKKALAAAGDPVLAYTPAAYKALYNGEGSNTESFFYLAINTSDNWSANSCGTLWSNYSYGPTPYLKSIMTDGDVRRAVWSWNTNDKGVEEFGSGKFGAYGLGGNSAYGTNYLINAPEMYLNQAEGYLRSSSADITNAQNALLVVAKRNPAITSVADLPSDKDGLMSFIQEERARELFQEGHRLYDLRRWDVSANLAQDNVSYPEIDWAITGFKISDCVYPIPADEINAGFGVTQNEGWQTTFPKK